MIHKSADINRGPRGGGGPIFRQELILTQLYKGDWVGVGVGVEVEAGHGHVWAWSCQYDLTRIADGLCGSDRSYGRHISHWLAWAAKKTPLARGVGHGQGLDRR